MSMEKEQNKKTVGILNRGKNNTLVNNTFNGLDVGIQDEGEYTFASGNKFNNGESVEEKARQWFSMNNPIVYIAAILVISAIAYLAFKFGLPLKFDSN